MSKLAGVCGYSDVHYHGNMVLNSHMDENLIKKNHYSYVNL